jgi:hypothetical protein
VDWTSLPSMSLPWVAMRILRHAQIDVTMNV